MTCWYSQRLAEEMFDDSDGISVFGIVIKSEILVCVKDLMVFGLGFTRRMDVMWSVWIKGMSCWGGGEVGVWV